MKMFLIFLFFVINIFAQDFRSSADIFFKDKKYEEAIPLYEKIEHKDFYDFFNLGISYFKQGEYFFSLLNFKKAEKLSSFKNFETINTNLRLIENKLNITTNENLLYNRFLKLFNIFFLQIFLIVFLYLIFLNIYFWKNRFKILNVFLIFIFLIFSLIYFLKLNKESKSFCLIKNLTELKIGPGDYHLINNLAVGQELEIIQKNGEWYLVKFFVGKTKNIGWVNSHDCVDV